MIEPRQSTTVPNTSNVRAFTCERSDCAILPPEYAVLHQ
jgi:hypothetical protein